MTETQFKSITPFDSYSEAKGQLWQTYMSSITPELKAFQKLTREVCEKVNQKPTKANQKKGAELVKKGLAKYLEFCQDAFWTYIWDLQVAYIEDQYKMVNLDPSLVFAKKETKKPKSEPKKRTKSVAARSKTVKKTPKKKVVKASKKYEDAMRKKFNVKKPKK